MGVFLPGIVRGRIRRVRLAPSLKRSYLIYKFANILFQPLYHVIQQAGAGRSDKAALQQSFDIFHHSIKIRANVFRSVAYYLIDTPQQLGVQILRFICRVKSIFGAASQLKLSRVWLFHGFNTFGKKV